MIIEWNYGAIAQLHQGQGLAVWNWSIAPVDTPDPRRASKQLDLIGGGSRMLDLVAGGGPRLDLPQGGA